MATSRRKGLRILQVNINGMRGRHPHLQRCLEEHRVDVALVQETKLTARDKTPQTPGYSTLRRDREIHRRGNQQPQGGLAILVRRGIAHEEVDLGPLPQGACLERQSVVVHVLHQEPITLTNIYRPPARRAQDDNREAGLHLDCWPSTPGHFVLGDVNAHGAWDESHAGDDLGAELDEWMADNLWQAFNTGAPTYISSVSGAGSALDATLGHASWSGRVKWSLAQAIGSDHLPILVDLETGPPGDAQRPRARRNHKKADWPRFREAFDEIFSGLEPGDSVDAWNRELSNCIQEAASRSVPMGAFPRPKWWWNDRCSEAVTGYRRALSESTRHPNNEAAAEASRRAREAADQTIREVKTTAWTDYMKTLDPRTPATDIWRVAKSVDGKSRTPLPDTPVTNPSGKKAISDSEKAEAAGAAYAATSRTKISRADSKAAVQAVRDYLRAPRPEEHEDMEQPFSRRELDTALRHPGGKSPGHDGIHPMLLRKLPSSGKAALLQVINRSWAEGRVPASWRKAVIIPIIKPGKDPASIKSYRPVSLLPCSSKVMEAMVQHRLQQWAERNNLLPPSQAGFRRHRSTVDALCSLLQPSFDGLQHQPMHRSLLVAVDFRAAFDTVWRDGLLKILAEARIPHGWLRWIRAFLKDRRGRVRWNNAEGRWRIFKQGVPQGSPLSPLLFIRTLPETIQEASPTTDPTAFADDLTLRNTHPDPQVAALRMQAALTSLEEWCRRNYVTIAPEKTEALLITTHPAENKAKLKPHLTICGAPVAYKETVKILGVSIDTTLTLAPHAREAALKMRRRCGGLKTIAAKSWGASTDALRTLYEGYVRPAGAYAAGAWWPFISKTNAEKLEAANYMAARVITGAHAGTNAAATVQEAGLPTFAETAKEEATRQSLLCHRFPEGHKLRRLVAQPDVRPRQKVPGGGIRGSWRTCADSTTASAGITGLTIEPLVGANNTPPPWEHRPNVHFLATEGTTRDSPPEVRRAAAETLMENLRTTDPPDAEVWSDGSADEGTRNGGAGAIVKIRGQDDVTISKAAGVATSSTAAEAAALTAGLEELQRLTQDAPEMRIWVAFDSRALFDRLQDPGRSNQDLATARASCLIHDLGKHHRIFILWIPGHAGIPPNEAADAAAKEGSRRPQEGIQVTYTAAKNTMRSYLKASRRQVYKDKVGADHHHLKVTGGEPLPDYPGRTRRRDVLLHQLRLGRGPFLQGTKHRWGRVPTATCPHCDTGEEEDADHFFTRCPRWATIRAQVLGPNPSLREVLQDSPSRAIEFAEKAGY